MSETGRRHPARAMPYIELAAALAASKAAGDVTEATSADGLRIFCYSRACVYEHHWSEITCAARGLIVDPAAERVVATPFPKFFNVGERGEALPNLPFEVTDKMDGSLIVLFYHNGAWRSATKGAFDSPQARMAASRIADCDLSALDSGATYLAELIGPTNRVVIRYDEDALVLLAGYDCDGFELPYAEIVVTAQRLGWRAVPRRLFASFAELLAQTRTLPATEEGFVVRFADGTRLKVKGEEYRRIHSMVSRVTPLAMWEAMRSGADLAAMRRDLPEEFWADFDGIVARLDSARQRIIQDTADVAVQLSDLTDKDVGLGLSELPEHVRPFIFPYRKTGGDLQTGRTRDAIFRAIRPTGNDLPGYIPSYAMGLVLTDA